MRINDALLGLLAAVLGVFSVILAFADYSWYGVSALIALAVAALLLMVARVASTPKVLLVGEPRGVTFHDLRAELDEAGFAIVGCTGPEDHPCPVFEGQPCPVHSKPAAAVIFERAGYAAPHAPCGRALDVPALTLDENSDGGPDGPEWDLSLGWRRGPREVARTARRIATSHSDTAA